MRKLFLLVFAIFISYAMQGQSLNTIETIKYINNLFKDSQNRSYNNHYKITLEKNGLLTIYNYERISFDEPFKKYEEAHFNINDISSIGEPYEKIGIMFWCKRKGNIKSIGNISREKCINTRYSQIPREYFEFTDFKEDYVAKKARNAFSYLLSIAIESGKYKRNDDDPFAPKNYTNDLFKIIGSKSQSSISLQESGGVYKLWVKIGSVKKLFILDSGASELAISKETERDLISLGIISKKNYLPSGPYRLADGSIVEARRILIPSIQVGDFTVYNVTTSVGGSGTPLLLGRSFLDKFKKWSIDNSNNYLILEK